MKHVLLLIAFIVSLKTYSQDNGRISQSTTLIIWYKVLPNNTYDIFVQNADKDTSVIQYVLNDTTYNVSLGHWERHQFISYYPNGFTLRAKNMSNYFGKWQECGSKRWAEGVIYNITKPVLITTACNGWYIIPNSIKQ